MYRVFEALDELSAIVEEARGVPMTAGCEPSRHLFQILVDRRDEVMTALNSAGVYPGVHYQDNTLYRMYAHANGTCPAAHRASERLVSLPMHLGLSFADVERVSASLLQIVGRRRSAEPRGRASVKSIG